MMRIRKGMYLASKLPNRQKSKIRPLTSATLFSIKYVLIGLDLFKIHVLVSTILKVLLSLVPNRNCVGKSRGLTWPILEITSLKILK